MFIHSVGAILHAHFGVMHILYMLMLYYFKLINNIAIDNKICTYQVDNNNNIK